MTDIPSGPTDAGKTEVTSGENILVNRLAVWLLFGAVFGLLPLIATGIRDAMSLHGLRFIELLGGGELFVVGAVIAAGAIGELFAGGALSNGPNLWTILVGFATLLAFLGNTVGYMSIPTSSPLNVMHWSSAFYLYTLLAGGFSIGMAVGR